MVRRPGRQRNERHRDRGLQRRTRHPGHEFGRDSARFDGAQQHRQTGEVGERVAEDAEREILTVETLDEAVDHLARAAHEQGRIADPPAQHRDPLALEEERQFGRGLDGDRAAHRAQRFEAAQGEQIGVAGAQPHNTQHPLCFRGGGADLPHAVVAEPSCGFAFGESNSPLRRSGA